MTIEIVYFASGNHYQWKLWDGPDGSSFRMGYCDDLQSCIHKIEIARREIALEYIE